VGFLVVAYFVVEELLDLGGRRETGEHLVRLSHCACAVVILTGMWELRLGDEIDDYCIKCRRLTNHSIVSMVDAKAAKVRCRTCYSDHDFRNEQAPPSKKELARQKELFNAVLAGVAPDALLPDAIAPPPEMVALDPPEAPPEPETKVPPPKAKKRKV